MSAKHSGNFANKSYNGIAPTSASIVLRPSKKQGFLSFLCCGVPDSFNLLDANETSAHTKKITKISAVRPTTSSRPDQSNNQNSSGLKNKVSDVPFTEKEEKQQVGKQTETRDGNSVACEEDNFEKKPLPGPINGSSDLILDDSPESKTKTEKRAEIPNLVLPSSINSTSTLQSCQNPSLDQESHLDSSRENVDYEDSLKVPSLDPVVNDRLNVQSSILPKRLLSHEIPSNSPLNTAPIASGLNDVNLESASEQKQQWLLPPIEPHLKGKKCLVLDLDKTLVHSSFKANTIQHFLRLILLISPGFKSS